MRINLSNSKFNKINGGITINFYGDSDKAKEVEKLLNTIIRSAIDEYNSKKLEMIFTEIEGE